MRRRQAAAVAAAAFIALATPAAAADGGVSPDRVRYTWVRIGDAGNPPDTTVMSSDRTTSYGSVPYAYRIGKFDVTNAQYAAFLNAVASKSDPHLLFFPCMNRAQCYHEGSGVALTVSAGHYHYAPQPGRAQMPINYVNLFMAMRFANWMNNGQGDASTEYGAYTLDGNGIIPTNLLNIHRTAGAKVFLPNEDEWYKAAYWDQRKQRYYAYPAGTDSPTICALPGPTPDTANCGGITAEHNPANPGLPSTAGWFYNDVTPVGAYTGSPSPYGTYDQGGDVFQWTEDFTDAVIDQYQAGAAIAPLTDAIDSIIGSPFTPGFGPLAVVRGTDFGDAGSYNASASRSCDVAADPFETYGFRLAATIPHHVKEQ